MIHRAHIYIRRDRQRAILVPVHNNQHGIGFEDDTPSTLEGPLDPDQLGKSARLAAVAAGKRERHLRGMKLTDWPAYRSSGARSVSQFEEQFIALRMVAANDSNLVYVITGEPSKDYDLRVTASISSSAAFSKIGELIMRVFEACRDKTL